MSIFCTLFLLSAAPAQDMVGLDWAGNAYAINSATGTGSLLGGTGYSTINSMAKSPSGVLYAMAGYGGPNALITINPATGAGTLVAWSNLDSVRGLAFDGAGTLYAINDSSGTGIGIDHLYVVNTTTAVGTLVGSTNYAGVQGLAWANGTLYAWEIGSGSGFGDGLMTVNVATGALTDVNPSVGGYGSEAQTLCSSSSGQLYGATTALYTIDAGTGVLTLVGSGGYSDVRGIEFTGAGGPALSKSGSCPGPVTLTVAGCTPNRPVAMLYGNNGTFTYGGTPCTGITLDMSSPTLAGVLTANGGGVASISFNAPPGVCGKTVQAVNVATCTKSNTIIL